MWTPPSALRIGASAPPFAAILRSALKYYVRGAAPGAGYRNGYRTGRLKTAEDMIEYAAPQISDRALPFHSRLREIVRGRSEELEALAIAQNGAQAEHRVDVARRDLHA